MIWIYDEKGIFAPIRFKENWINYVSVLSMDHDQLAIETVFVKQCHFTDIP